MRAVEASPSVDVCLSVPDPSDEGSTSVIVFGPTFFTRRENFSWSNHEGDVLIALFGGGQLEFMFQFGRELIVDEGNPCRRSHALRRRSRIELGGTVLRRLGQALAGGRRG